MKLCLYHGRLSPTSGGTDIDGNEVDDWGFEGPVVEEISTVDFTYGTIELCFASAAAYERAKALTGWRSGVREEALELAFAEDCVSTFNAERNRHEYFGDFNLETEAHPSTTTACAFITSMPDEHVAEWLSAFETNGTERDRRFARMLTAIRDGCSVPEVEVIGLAWWEFVPEA